jgi:hypothetical protein
MIHHNAELHKWAPYICGKWICVKAYYPASKSEERSTE